MKIALCTTTINDPKVLKVYRDLDAAPRIFVAGDLKTPPAAHETVHGLRDAVVITTEQSKPWRCSDLIGWNSIQRRNIAFLEALKWGADVIASIDDDNIPLRDGYCADHAFNLKGLHSGIAAVGDWFDVGTLLQPAAKHRGFPHNMRRSSGFSHKSNAKVGVSAGICLGDPDIDAVTRMAMAPEVHQVSQILENGLLVDNHTWTVFNSQNTAIRRELVPAWGMIPFTGRMDDIYASLIVQRVMRERDMHVHFGLPFVWQSRNQHNLVKDLLGEIEGYENVVRLADVLDHLVLTGKTVIDDCRRIWETLSHVDWIPGRSVAAMVAYLNDCESVL